MRDILNKFGFCNMLQSIINFDQSYCNLSSRFVFRRMFGDPVMSFLTVHFPHIILAPD